LVGAALRGDTRALFVARVFAGWFSSSGMGRIANGFFSAYTGTGEALLRGAHGELHWYLAPRLPIFIEVPEKSARGKGKIDVR